MRYRCQHTRVHLREEHNRPGLLGLAASVDLLCCGNTVRTLVLLWVHLREEHSRLDVLGLAESVDRLRCCITVRTLILLWYFNADTGVLLR